MTLSRSWFRQALVVAALAPTLSAHAGYFKWESVELPASSGASCGNGTPYRFFVNRTFLTSKTVVMYEGGGACWTQGACKGESGMLGASNPNGVPSNYMTSTSGMAALGLITPFTARIHPLTSVQTQGWNIVYVPYCTGDVHTGNKVNVYDDAQPDAPTTYYHRGIVNGNALANWLAANLSRPSKLLVTGFSAGGAGARLSASLPAGSFDVNNVGTLPQALATAYPNDRMGYALFKQDLIYSAFSYQAFNPQIA